jgi:hypothetical protein
MIAFITKVIINGLASGAKTLNKFWRKFTHPLFKPEHFVKTKLMFLIRKTAFLIKGLLDFTPKSFY